MGEGERLLTHFFPGSRAVIQVDSRSGLLAMGAMGLPGSPRRHLRAAEQAQQVASQQLEELKARQEASNSNMDAMQLDQAKIKTHVVKAQKEILVSNGGEGRRRVSKACPCSIHFSLISARCLIPPHVDPPPTSPQGLQAMGHVAMAADATAKQVKQDYDAARAAMEAAAQNSAVSMIRPLPQLA